MTTVKDVPTYVATIYVGGDVAVAREFLRRECYERGLCVTVTPTTFIYTGGEETGIAVGLVNYPRFPSEPFQIFDRACMLASRLICALCQKSALVVASDQSRWITVTPPGART